MFIFELKLIDFILTIFNLFDKVVINFELFF